MKCRFGVPALLCYLLAAAASLSAHPLGNFTLNHLTELTFSPGSVALRYVLDMAEIPTYQTMHEATPHGKLDGCSTGAVGAT